MKFRYALVLVATIGALVPATARAEHCDIPVYIFSRTRVDTGIDDPTHPGRTLATVPSLVSSFFGCDAMRDTVVGGEDPSVHQATETDLIYPYSNRLSVRLLIDGAIPADVASASLTFAGETYALTMEPGVDLLGAATTAFMNSQMITIDPADTLSGNEATATVCMVSGDCFTRTYKTVG